MDDQKKPKEYRRFENLAKRLVSVPKTTLDEKMKEYDERKSTRRSKKRRKKSED